MNKRRSDLAIMRKLIVLIKPLTGVMLTGIILGVLGFLCAIFLTILGGYGILKGISELPALHNLSGASFSMPGGLLLFCNRLLAEAFYRDPPLCRGTGNPALR